MKIRPSFFLPILLVSIILICSCNKKPHDYMYEQSAFWTENYFQQNRVLTPEPDSKIIEAMIDGVWKKYQLRDVTAGFMEWNIQRRITSIDDIRKGKRPDWAGSHNGVVATYGLKREDTQFRLNNAVKGMGFLPKAHKLEEITELLRNTKESPVEKKLEILVDLYDRAEELFDLDKQVSLELYPTPEYETQTFINQMSNPVSTIVFLDVPSFKLKTISRLLHPDDPDLNAYERSVIRYVNDVYSYFHGNRGKDFITTIYYIVEVYDNSPGRKDARGTRVDQR